MLAQWAKCLDKRPSDRTDDDLEIIYKQLRSHRLFRRIHPSVVQQLCFVAFVELIQRGVIVVRQGDDALNWYAVIYGSLDVRVSHTGKAKDVVTLCTLGIGTAFGGAVLHGGTHSVSVITNEPCTLLRVAKADFQDIWHKNSHLMEDIVSPLQCHNPQQWNGMSLTDNHEHENTSIHAENGLMKSAKVNNKPPIVSSVSGSSATSSSASSGVSPGPKMTSDASHPLKGLCRIGWVLRTIMLSIAPHLIRDRKYHHQHNQHQFSVNCHRRCMVGSEMVDWIISLSMGTQARVRSRGQAAALWQVLLEENIIQNVDTEQEFIDKYIFYRFCFDSDSEQNQQLMPLTLSSSPLYAITIDDKRIAESELMQSLATLIQMAPDATFRQILRKCPNDRTPEEIEIVYEELLHIKALSHLSNSVKKELSSFIVFESHQNKGIVLFNQGDAGTCWYIILGGSVNVVIAGKGVVCTLHRGDDFGKLALVNEAPRAATIITNESNCQFLRVDKSDFDRILRDVEANTVRLKEHGKEVLILQKMAGNITIITNENGTTGGSSHYKYMVMAGTPEKMLEHLLETRMDTVSFDDITLSGDKNSDFMLLDFLLTHPVFISAKQMCHQLMRYYRIDEHNARQEKEFIIASKRRVIKFMSLWMSVAGDPFLSNPIIWTFVQDLVEAIQKDSEKYGNTFNEELLTMKTLMETKAIYDIKCEMRGTQKWKADTPGPVRKLSTIGNDIIFDPRKTVNKFESKLRWDAMRPKDELISRVYCADHTYTTLKLSVDTKAEVIKTQAAEKLGMEKYSELILVEVKSNGDRLPFRDSEVSIPTAVTLNGRIFVSHVDHLDALVTLPEQEGPTIGSAGQIEQFSAHQIAYHLTQHGWNLFNNVHHFELLYQVFGRHNFTEITANLDLFLRHFNEIQYWVISEIVLEKSISKRINLLRKFIKISGHCKEYQNVNAFFAIIMGLSNVAVSRLTQTWEKLPSKFKRTFAQYESLIDPSRNHQRYRILVSKMVPPIIPFMPLLLKDITFAHEGNKTYIDAGLVNFEKMHMIAQTLRLIDFCRCEKLSIEPPTPTSKSSSINCQLLKQYIQDIEVIDSQRRLNQLSHAIEHRKN